MTPEDWKTVEERLTWPYGVAILRCDEYRLTLRVQQDKMRLVIGFYVNGWFKGEWMLKDCEERRRFFRPSEVYLHKAKLRTPEMIRLHKKLKLPPPDGKMTQYWYFWTAFKALKAHLIKNNKTIELVTE